MKPIEYPLLIYSPIHGQEISNVTNHTPTPQTPAALVAA